MTADIIDPITGSAADLKNVTAALEAGGTFDQFQPRPLVTPDSPLRAEVRLWGSYPRAMRAMTRPLDRDERPATQMAAVGFSNGPVGRKDRILTDGINPQVLA